MGMDLDQLETLVAVAEEGGISAAARRRNLSQPAVSLQMKALEGELGVILLHRHARGTSLTQAGSALLGHARLALMAVRSARSEVAEIRGLVGGTFRLGTTDAAATGILPRAFFEFHRRHPGIEVAVAVEPTSHLVEGLERGHLDLGLGTLPVDDPKIESRVLVRERLGLVAPAHCGSTPIRRLLERQPFIAYPRESTTRRLVDEALGRAGLRVRPVMEIGRPSVMARLVEAGLGVSVLPETTVRRRGRAALHVFDRRKFSVVRELGLLLLRGRDLEPSSRAFIRVLDETCDALP